MPPERHEPDSFEAWLDRAASDLSIARADIPGAFLEDHCYHAQQCIEKAMKAVLLKKAGTFPYVHDLSELVNSLQKQGILVPFYVEDAVTLTPFAVEGRYPGVSEDVTPLERADAVRKARMVLDWARNECERFTQSDGDVDSPENKVS